MNNIVKPLLSRFVRSALILVALQFLSLALSDTVSSVCAQNLRPKSKDNPYFYGAPECDLRSDKASSDAIELARLLNLTSALEQLEEARKKLQLNNGDKGTADLREEIRDLRVDLAESIEQARLEVEFVQAEMAVEIAGQHEMVLSYSDARDNRVNRMNNWAFRTNGVLWAVAEGLDIPTYSRPRYSIPSGTTGIIAGIVPSLFSLFAVRESGGGRYERTPRQNMLAKVFDYPTNARIDYPDSVLAFLRSVPKNASRSRIDQLIDRWIEDKNVHSFSDRNSRQQLDVITGSVQKRLTIQLCSDRLAMLQQLSALVSQMNRPLLELMMVVRGVKHFPVSG